MASSQEQASFLELLCMTDDDEAAAASASFLMNCNSSAAAGRNFHCRPAGGLLINQKLAPEDHLQGRHHEDAAHAEKKSVDHDDDDDDDQSLQEAVLQVQLQRANHLLHQQRHQQAQDNRSYNKFYNQSQLQRSADHHNHFQQQLLQEHDSFDISDKPAYHQSFNFDNLIPAIADLNSTNFGDNHNQHSSVIDPASTSPSISSCAHLGSYGQPLPARHVAPDRTATSDNSSGSVMLKRNESSLRSPDTSNVELPSVSTDDTSM